MNGLDGTVGDLMTLPKSQYSVMERGGFQSLWKDAKLPGAVFFGEGNPLPPVRAKQTFATLLNVEVFLRDLLCENRAQRSSCTAH